MKAISLFSGIGLAETYFKELGIDVILANEKDQERSKLYQYLYPSTKMLTGDIKNQEIQKILIDTSKNIDLLIATPPCQGMSIAGKRIKGDPRNHLIYDAIQIIKKIQPKFIFLENVPMQLKTKIIINNQTLLIPDYIIQELSSLYNFNNSNIIKAMDYGVAQMRSRNIILLTKKNLNIEWEFPEKKDEVITLKKLLHNVPSLDPYVREGYEQTIKLFPDFEIKRNKGLKLSKWHYPPTHAMRHIEWMSKTPSGETAFNNKIFYPQKPNGERIKGHYNHYRRLSWDKPSRTITQNNGVISSLACVHPGYRIKDGNESNRLYSDPRTFTIYELMLISSLPKNWKLPNWSKESFIRKGIGEGIPPILVKKIMKGLIKLIN